ncbi:MAG: IS110 family transposase [Hyphomicrobiaceae bacterium]
MSPLDGTKPELFENGRHLAAWIGIAPENDSMGGKPKQKGLCKKGGRYLRALLINDTMAIVRQARMRTDKYPWVARLLTRMSSKQAAIAIANKTALIAWVLMVRGGVCKPGHRPPAYRGTLPPVAG